VRAIPHLRPTPPRDVVVVTVIATVAYAIALSVAMHARSYDFWGALVLAPVLIVVSLPLLSAIARRDGTPGIFTLLVVVLVLKLVAAGARYWMAFIYYGGSDAAQYHAAGIELSELYRQGIFTTNGRELSNTAFLEVVTGAVYTVTGPTLLGGFVLFSWLSFWGLVMLWRAFRVGVPHGAGRRYAWLVLFLPSMLFWPSAMGKEAFMSLALGASALGAARLFAARGQWLLPLAAGMAGTTLMRPHFTALVFCALFAGYLFRTPARRTPLTPVIKVGGIAVLVVVGLLVAREAAEFLGVDASAEGVDQALSSTAQRTSIGGSSFEAEPVEGPLDLPRAFMTVAFRPFPWEASSLQAGLQAIESAFILALFVWSWPRVRTVGRHLRTHPYITFCLVYALLFVYAYSTFGNFGLLARQRVLLYPFLLVLVCLPATRIRGPLGRASGSVTHPRAVTVPSTVPGRLTPHVPPATPPAKSSEWPRGSGGAD
jgi:hypothetical protein